MPAYPNLGLLPLTRLCLPNSPVPAAEMKTIDDVEPEIDIDDLDEDWSRDREEDEEEGRQGRGSTNFGQV